MTKSRGRNRKTRIAPVSPLATRIERQQLEAFRKKFGRDPRPDESPFFDPDQAAPIDPNNIFGDIIKVMRKAGAQPEVMYAFKRTGLLGVPGAMDNWPADRRKEWEDAIDEYFRVKAKAKAKPERRK
jgi:hypothetical protein